MNIFSTYRRKSNAIFTFLTMEIIISVVLLLVATICVVLEAEFDWDLRYATWIIIALLALSSTAFLYYRHIRMKSVTKRLQIRTSHLSRDEFVSKLNVFLESLNSDIERNRLSIEMTEAYDIYQISNSATKFSKLLIQLRYFFRFV